MLAISRNISTKVCRFNVLDLHNFLYSLARAGVITSYNNISRYRARAKFTRNILFCKSKDYFQKEGVADYKQ